MIASSTSGSAEPASPRFMDQRSYRAGRDAGAASVKIEQILQKRAPPALSAVLLASVGAIVAVPIALIPDWWRRGPIALVPVRRLC